MKLPDIKDSGKDLVHAVVKTTFEPQTKDFNGKVVTSMGAYIIVDGKEYNHYFKEKYFGLAKPGAKILGMKKLYMGKPFYEWFQDVQNEHSYEAPNAPNPGESDFSAPTPPKEDKPDWDAIAEGKVRSLLVQSFVQKNGLIELSEIDKEKLTKLVTFCMNGK